MIIIGKCACKLLARRGKKEGERKLSESAVLLLIKGEGNVRNRIRKKEMKRERKDSAKKEEIRRIIKRTDR
jgi:hypothetical protein